MSYLSLLEKLTPTGTYGLYTGFCVIGYVFVIFCYPETSTFILLKLTIHPNDVSAEGLSIDETEVLFTDSFGVKTSVAMRKDKDALRKQLNEGAAISA